jgi:hypothetical protein
VTDDDDIPPEWVPWFELLRWVIWIARRYHALELDEGSAKRLIPDVVLALRHKVDERTEPRLGLWDRGQFVGEIGWLSDYRIDWRTGRTQRVDHLEDDPPHLRDQTFTLAVAWDWLTVAVKQAEQFLTDEGSDSARPKREWRPGDAPRSRPERVAQTLYDLHQSHEIDVMARPSVYNMATKVQTRLGLKEPISKATLDRGLVLARKAVPQAGRA